MKIHNGIFRATLLIAFAAATNSVSAAPGTPTRTSCATQNADARQRSNYPVEWPRIAEGLALTNTAIVRVDLSEGGAVRKATVVASSGNASLDSAARESTLQQRYTPEIRNCANIAGSHLVEVDFSR